MRFIELHHNSIYGYSDLTERKFTVFNSDTEQLFKEHLDSQPHNWEYRNKEITYQRNEYGHRNKSINELSDDFILCSGCSLTEGIGLHNDDIYPTLLSKSLNKDVYNLGLASSGQDLIYYNLSLWFGNIKKKPKLVVIQDTYNDRAFIDKNGGILPLGPWFDRIPKDMLTNMETENFKSLVLSEFSEHYNVIMKQMFLSHMASLNIPVITIDPDDFKPLDFARDLKHPGVKTHRHITDLVLKAVEASSIL